jgi:nucleoside-diphosphate-sugar epimerase
VRILITGAGGFVGRALTAQLLAAEPVGEAKDQQLELLLLDHQLGDLPGDPRLAIFEGDLGNPALLERAIAGGVDRVFHLASVPGGAAEAHFEHGLKVNLDATVGLLEALRRKASRPRYVFASTIGVYGVPMPDLIDEQTVPAPSLSYGAHKLVGEILAADYSRRGYIDGVSLRLPGIVARPPQATGMLSAFLSDMLREVARGQRFVCPVARTGVSWWMSRACVVDNLLHAGELPESQLARGRTWLLPVLRESMAEVVAALGSVYGVDAEALVSYRDDPGLRAQFASFPPLRCPDSLAAGFRSDGTVESMVRRALEGLSGRDDVEASWTRASNSC